MVIPANSGTTLFVFSEDFLHWPSFVVAIITPHPSPSLRQFGRVCIVSEDLRPLPSLKSVYYK